MLNILFIGDVVGERGCKFVRDRLPQLRQLYRPGLVIANGENSANGNGILPCSAESLFNSGVDVITTGNHVWQRKEIFDYIPSCPQLIRPANYPAGAPGNGYYIAERGGLSICVINLMGTAFMDPLDNPFAAADALLSSECGRCDIIIVDFHAEATAEKRAMGFYLDGRVTAVIGTHTHVQTADAQLLQKGAAYITDVGMTGAVHSVLGMRCEDALRRFTTRLPQRLRQESGPYLMCSVLLEIDDASRRALSIRGLQLFEEE